MVTGVLIATVSMVVRYRRSADVQRAQMRWIAAAVVLFAGAGLPFVIVRYGLDLPYSSGSVLLALALVAGCFLPVAAAVAILRHRLYDIDLILNRALVYIPLTGILGGLYAAGVALFQRLFQAVTGDKSDGAVVIATLVLAGTVHADQELAPDIRRQALQACFARADGTDGGRRAHGRPARRASRGAARPHGNGTLRGGSDRLVVGTFTHGCPQAVHFGNTLTVSTEWDRRTIAPQRTRRDASRTPIWEEAE